MLKVMFIRSPPLSNHRFHKRNTFEKTHSLLRHQHTEKYQCNNDEHISSKFAKIYLKLKRLRLHLFTMPCAPQSTLR